MARTPAAVVADMDAADPRGEHVVGLEDIAAAGRTIGHVEVNKNIKIVCQVAELLQVHYGRHFKAAGGGTVLDGNIRTAVEPFKVLQPVPEKVARYVLENGRIGHPEDDAPGLERMKERMRLDVPVKQVIHRFPEGQRGRQYTFYGHVIIHGAQVNRINVGIKPCTVELYAVIARPFGYLEYLVRFLMIIQAYLE